MLVPLLVLITGILLLRGLLELMPFLLRQHVHVVVAAILSTMFAPYAISVSIVQEVLEQLAHQVLLLHLLVLLVLVSVYAQSDTI